MGSIDCGSSLPIEVDTRRSLSILRSLAGIMPIEDDARRSISIIRSLAGIMLFRLAYDTFGALVQLPVPLEVEFQNCYFL